MVADANLFTRDDSASLTKERSEPELIIGCTYKFKVFKLSPTLFFYIYWYIFKIKIYYSNIIYINKIIYNYNNNSYL